MHFQIIYTVNRSVKTVYSAEDISLYERQVITETIHCLCHDWTAILRNHGDPQDVVGELPDQGYIIFAGDLPSRKLSSSTW